MVIGCFIATTSYGNGNREGKKMNFEIYFHATQRQDIFSF